nr:hypothetical protein [Tanacetum cinerariifolium]
MPIQSRGHRHNGKAPSFVHNSEHVKSPKPYVKPVEHHIPAKNLRKDILKSRGHRHSWHVVATVVLTRSRIVSISAARPVTTVVPQTKVQHQRPTKHGVTKAHSPIKRPINLKPSPTHSNFQQKVTTVKAIQVNAIQGVKGNRRNPQHTLKDKGVLDSGCSRHVIGNISYLSNFKEINRGYVAFGGNPKGGKIADRTQRMNYQVGCLSAKISQPHNKQNLPVGTNVHLTNKLQEHTVARSFILDFNQSSNAAYVNDPNESRDDEDGVHDNSSLDVR